MKNEEKRTCCGKSFLPKSKIYVQIERPEQTEPMRKPKQIFFSLNTEDSKVSVVNQQSISRKRIW